MGKSIIVPEPKILWDLENECWIIKHGEITISFFDPGDLIVSGHEVTAQVTYDQITEERGLRFQDWKSRDYEHQIRKDSMLKEGEEFNPVPHIVNPEEDD